MAQATYLSVAELVECYDERVLAELSSDDGTLGTVSAGNTILETCIERASSDVESAVLTGKRWTVTQLQALQADDNWTLKGLVADLAIRHLYSRRGAPMPEAWQAKAQRAERDLEALRTGSAIFRDDDAADAGQPQPRAFTDAQRRNLSILSDAPFFPGRLNRRLAGGERT